MKIVITLFIIFAFQNVYACTCRGNCLEKEYDIAAIIEIIDESSEYAQAYKARVQNLAGWNEPVLKDGVLYKLFMNDIEHITVIEGSVRKISKDQKGERIQSISSCGRSYNIGQKLYFFGKEVEDGIYESNSCTCTRLIK